MAQGSTLSQVTGAGRSLFTAEPKRDLSRVVKALSNGSWSKAARNANPLDVVGNAYVRAAHIGGGDESLRTSQGIGARYRIFTTTARQLRAATEHANAALRYTQQVSGHPDHIEALVLKAETLIASGKVHDPAPAAGATPPATPDPADAEYADQILNVLRAHNHADGYYLTARIVGIPSPSDPATYRAALIESISNLRQALTINSEHAQARLLLARRYSQLAGSYNDSTEKDNRFTAVSKAVKEYESLFTILAESNNSQLTQLLKGEVVPALVGLYNERSRLSTAGAVEYTVPMVSASGAFSVSPCSPPTTPTTSTIEPIPAYQMTANDVAPETEIRYQPLRDAMKKGADLILVSNQRDAGIQTFFGVARVLGENTPAARTETGINYTLAGTTPNDQEKSFVALAHRNAAEAHLGARRHIQAAAHLIEATRINPYDTTYRQKLVQALTAVSQLK